MSNPTKVQLKRRSRNWMLTLNNPTEEDKETLLKFPCKYVVFQLEKGKEKGTLHYQGVMCLENAVQLDFMRQIHGKAHWEACHSTDASIKYCQKDDTFVDGPWEAGTKPAQGKRNDLKKVKDEIVAGKRTVDEICVDDPSLYHQYGRTLHKLEDLQLRKRFRTTMTKGIWLWGPSGVGKSHEAFKDFTPQTHYVWANDNGWQDGYVGQETVIINDFRGHIKYDELLQMVDKWPYAVRRRCREPAPFLAKKVIITSALPPAEVYNNRSERDSIDQLMRRFEVKHMPFPISRGEV